MALSRRTSQRATIVSTGDSGRSRHKGLKRTARLSEAARHAMRAEFVKIAKYDAKVRAGNVDALHKMRVATRRMRSFLTVSRSVFKPSVVAWLGDGLRRERDMLGGVRDMDVLLGHLQDFRKETGAGDDGLDALQKIWESRRTQMQKRLFAYLDGKEHKQFKKRLRRFLETPGGGTRKEVKDRPRPSRVGDVAPALVAVRRAYVQAFLPIKKSVSAARLHRLRVECKKLRYTLEFFGAALGDSVDGEVERLTKVQDELGLLHDMVVGAELVDRVLAGWDARTATRGKRRGGVVGFRKWLVGRAGEAKGRFLGGLDWFGSNV